ncbi:hypothetical protein [Streptomyces sp. NBC_00198]|uniref:hypothetical protein n=1 Tax=Streptomyces sp. NBC_00198 TaxID=2975677 RepID=UPI00224D00BE|nr:hypothetical protein [Streptomyces sp. NBC_00198]MCX5285953.1 hypothetical protein [Streptomyces sp. NBC_00198]MCX5286262.1 hypothetical protein [Streptomyces sp. NBC_00198]
MSTLNWRTADVRLTDKLIPNPSNESQLLNHLTQVRVAVDNGFLHIDPRRDGQATAYPDPDTFTAHIVPAHQVQLVTYKAPVSAEPRVGLLN